MITEIRFDASKRWTRDNSDTPDVRNNQSYISVTTSLSFVPESHRIVFLPNKE